MPVSFLPRACAGEGDREAVEGASRRQAPSAPSAFAKASADETISPTRRSFSVGGSGHLPHLRRGRKDEAVDDVSYPVIAITCGA